ncbi:MAG TPA: polysaccharide biosynthesis protein [Planctomycetaceae bacterium]|nr:polysaccharide biosynthesis protein [Planctomycetaceae bacterium]
MRKRLALILPTYGVLYALCFVAAFLLRFDFQLPDIYQPVIVLGLPVVLGIKFCICLATGEWRRTYRYTTVTDLFNLIVGSATAAGFSYLALQLVLGSLPLPRTVLLIDAMLSILTVGLLRVGIRVITERVVRAGHARRALILGVDPDAVAIARSLGSSAEPVRVVGFVGERRDHGNALIAGIRVFPLAENGVLATDWTRLAHKQRADFVLLPSTVSGDVVRELIREFAGTSVRVQVMPTAHSLLGQQEQLAVRDVTISDLLRRDPAKLDLESIRKLVNGKRVLVTGAAGSIGSELCRQIASLAPESLVLVDHSETGIFHIENELADRPTTLHPVVASVVDHDVMRRVMIEHRPELVFHAAAYKHVPLMESNPQQAINNNIGGTRTMVDLADAFHVEAFVLISTDKAVDPSSIMGATKFVSEKYLQAVTTTSNTRMMIVRFGNVLDSAGSVVPTFRAQIAAGGPVTVTHPKMERFFMTIPEAVQLVLQAGAIGDSGDVLILEMGQPVKIVDLARDMIELSGLKYPDDIDIDFTGIRPGEKLTETLFYEQELGGRKIHDQIFRATGSLPSHDCVATELKHLEQSLNGSRAEAIEALKLAVQELIVDDRQNRDFRKAA